MTQQQAQGRQNSGQSDHLRTPAADCMPILIRRCFLLSLCLILIRGHPQLTAPQRRSPQSLCTTAVSASQSQRLIPLYLPHSVSQCLIPCYLRLPLRHTARLWAILSVSHSHRLTHSKHTHSFNQLSRPVPIRRPQVHLASPRVLFVPICLLCRYPLLPLPLPVRPLPA